MLIGANLMPGTNAGNRARNCEKNQVVKKRIAAVAFVNKV
jgi:hypothetical protein